MSKQWESAIDKKDSKLSPWSAEYDGDENSTSIRIFEGDRTVGIAVDVAKSDQRVIRRSRLMAAAPQLMDACVAALGMCDGSGSLDPVEVTSMLESAIAKAEGRK